MGALEAGVVPSEVKRGKATWYDASAVVVAEVIGVGVLGLPFTVSRLGWVPGIGLLTLVCLANMYSSMLIHRIVCTFPEISTFADIGSLIGKRWKYVAYISVNVFLFVLVVADFLTAAGALENFVETAFHEHNYKLELKWCGLILAAVILPVAQIQSLHGLTSLTVVGTITIILPLMITIVKLFLLRDDSVTVVTNTFPSEPSLVHTTSAIFTIVFAYCFQVVQVELQSEMAKPEDFSKGVYCTHAFIFIVYIVVSVIVYALKGDDVTNPVTELFDTSEPTTAAVINAMLFVHACVALSINSVVLNQVFVAKVQNWTQLASDQDGAVVAKATGALSLMSAGTDDASSTKHTVHTTSNAGKPSKLSLLTIPAERRSQTMALPSPLPVPSFSFSRNNSHGESGDHDHGGLRASRALWFGVSFSNLVVAYVLSNSIVSFGDFVSIIGASCGMFVAYILPFAFALALLVDKEGPMGVRTLERNFIWLCITIAVPLSIIGLYSTITLLADDLSKPGGDQHPWTS